MKHRRGGGGEGGGSGRRGGTRSGPGRGTRGAKPGQGGSAKGSARSRQAGGRPLSRARVLALLSGRGRPALTARTLLSRLGGRRPQARQLKQLLRSLVREGTLERVDRQYRLARPEGAIEGRLTAARAVEDAGGRVWQVEGTDGARPGERVLVRPLPGAPGRAEVLEALGERRREWVGIFHARKGGGFVTPYRDDRDWRLDVAPGGSAGARSGEVVVVVPAPGGGTARADGEAPDRVGVEERLGHPGDPEADFRAVVWRRQLPVDFPPEALAEAEGVPDELPREERLRRRDLRELPFVTIDPATARDHDDAICVEDRGGERTRLWVAIADVAYAVPSGSALDAEALRRGNSVYFPDRAIPMLPERLSGGLCSLRPQEDRPALVMELDVDAEGRTTRSRLHEAVVRSRARLTYEQAASVMEEGGRPDELAPGLVDPLLRLAALARRLMARRFADGSIDFDLPTAEIVLGDEGHPVDLVEAPRTLAHRAVEEAMLAANRAVAAGLGREGRPGIFRVHEPPAAPDLDALRELFESYGLLRRTGQGRRAPPALTPRAIGRALERARGHPEERVVNLVTLRSMRQARYAAVDKGHFALGFEHYCHFTSPIRRYADLVVHRALRDRLAERPPERGEEAVEALERVALRLSHRERAAMDAEREMVDLKKCAFMRGHVGEEHPGHVAGVARHGLYVRLDAFAVEGLVPASRLPGAFRLEESGRALVAPRSGARLELGDRVRIRVDSVDLVRAWITFELLEHESPRRSSAKKSKSKSAPRADR